MNKDNPSHMLDNYNDFLSVQNLAEIFGTTKGTIYKELHAGKFGIPLKIGRTYKIPKLYILQRYFNGY